MSGSRVYVPSTLTRLREVVASGALGPRPVFGHAVTDALRAAYADGGADEWEYAAMSSAAHDSLGLLTDADPARRVVIVVDGVTVVSAGPDEPSLVELRDVAPVRTIAAVHADSADAEPDVAAARLAWTDAQAGEPAASAVVERCLDRELGWFATQEIGVLLDR